MCKTAFDSWKKHDFPSGGDTHDSYRCARKEYRLLLRNFLNNLESDKVKKLCNAAESDEKLFWKLLKGQRSTSQMSAFLVENKLIRELSLIMTVGWKLSCRGLKFFQQICWGLKLFINIWLGSQPDFQLKEHV